MERKPYIRPFLFCLIALTVFFSLLYPSICSAQNVTLAWDPNSEPDLEGYVVYRNVGSPGPPYKFSSTLPEDDLSNPLIPVVTMTGLKENTEYFIAVTAYDTEGNESHFSNEICVEIVDSVIENCSASLSPGNSTGGGGGGSGSSGGFCFINIAAGDSNYVAVLLGVVIFLGFVMGAAKCVQIFMKTAIIEE